MKSEQEALVARYCKGKRVYS